MKIINNTHYYSFNNKTYNVVPDTDSWQFQSSKRLSYSQRLYWEYKYIRSVGGQAFFYTFTYNSEKMPHYEFEFFDFDKNELRKHRFPCFSYKHIRLLTNGIISKELRRKYGSQLRYFVACERGEGKGFRGKGMNPHYHVIFFISPLPDKVRKSKDVPYKRISPIQFCHLCKCVWQYNSSPNKYDHLVADYKSARFGHCEPGDDLGLITDFDALSYVSKYVVKDTLQTSDDLSVRNSFEDKFLRLGYTYHSLYSFYWYLRQDGSIISKQHFLEWSCLDSYFHWRRCYNLRSLNWYDYCIQYDYENFKAFFEKFEDYFKRLYIPAISKQFYRDYVNKFGSKVRCSKSLGIYGLSFVKDVSTNPHFVLYKSDEVVSQPICLYYFRKLYMDVVRCPVSGNPLYVLNEDGVNLKCLFLQSSLDKLKRDVYASLDLVNSEYTKDSFVSDLEFHGVSVSDYFKLPCGPLLHDLIDKFVVYRFVYQYRHYDKVSLPAISNGFTLDNILSDYRSFLQSNYYTCDYSEMFLVKLLEYRKSPFFVSFDSHPVFSSFIGLFKLLEGFFEVFREYMSEIKKTRFDDATELRQKLNSQKYSVVNSI